MLVWDIRGEVIALFQRRFSLPPHQTNFHVVPWCLKCVNAFTCERLYHWCAIWTLLHRVTSLTTWWQCVALRLTHIAFRPKKSNVNPHTLNNWRDRCSAQSSYCFSNDYMQKKKKKGFWLITAAVCVNMNCKLLFEQAKSSLIIQTCCKTARWGGNLKQPRLNEVLARHLGFVAAAGGWKERCHFQSGCQDAACICRSRSCSPRS